MNIQKTTTPNYSRGRNGKKIKAIVNHITAGSFPGCLNWMQNARSQASAHYLVTKAGDIYQLVEDENTAWHCGVVNRPGWTGYDGTNPNRYTIGIEHENISGGELTEAQYQASLWLHKQLLQKYDLPADREHIIGHYEIDSVSRANCPGKYFPWDRLMQDLQKKEEVEDMERYDTVGEMPEWARETVQKLINLQILAGDGTSLDLSQDMLRILVMNDRAGLYEKYQAGD